VADKKHVSNWGYMDLWVNPETNRNANIPNYCSNAMCVLEELNTYEEEWHIQKYNNRWFCYIGETENCANAVLAGTIHEAICRCAVEYLQAHTATTPPSPKKAMEQGCKGARGQGNEA
jgi:hypothetical protein